MRNRLFLCFVAAAGLIAASAAQAGTLTSASWLQVTQGVPLDRTSAQLGATGTSTSRIGRPRSATRRSASASRATFSTCCSGWAAWPRSAR